MSWKWNWGVIKTFTKMMHFFHIFYSQNIKPGGGGDFCRKNSGKKNLSQILGQYFSGLLIIGGLGQNFSRPFLGLLGFTSTKGLQL